MNNVSAFNQNPNPQILKGTEQIADCPAVPLDLCIYTAGGGNPLYRAELLKQCSNIKNKAIGLISFAELESCMHKVNVKANK